MRKESCRASPLEAIAAVDVMLMFMLRWFVRATRRSRASPFATSTAGASGQLWEAARRLRRCGGTSSGTPTPRVCAGLYANVASMIVFGAVADRFHIACLRESAQAYSLSWSPACLCAIVAASSRLCLRISLRHPVQSQQGRLRASLNGTHPFRHRYTPVSSKVALLRAEAVPSDGSGGTGFADARAAYDGLDDVTKARCEGMAAFHSYHYSMANDCANFPKAGRCCGVPSLCAASQSVGASLICLTMQPMATGCAHLPCVC